MHTILCMLLLWQTCVPSACPVWLVCRISLGCSTDWLACPSACPVQWVCRISLRRFSDRHACPSACPVRSVCRISLRRSSDRHARPSACPVRSVCRISLCRSADWRSRHLRFLAADLRLFSFSRDFDTAFAAAVIAPALVITMIQTESSLLQRSVAEEDCMPKRFCNDDMVWLILRYKTQTWKFMDGCLLPGKIIVICSASKVTTRSSVYQPCQVVLNSMLYQQGDNTLIIYQSCHAIVKQDDSHYTWLTLLWFHLRIWLSPSWILPIAPNALPRFYLRIWLSPSWILPIAANAFPASVPKNEQFQERWDDSHFLIPSL